MINILIVDDSAFMRQMFKKILEKDNSINVLDTARNGKEALDKIKKLNPDVITLDIEMPVKNGIETLEEIMKMKKPVPVIMVSAVTDRDTVMKALELGAFDFITKPSRPLALNLENIENKSIEKIKIAAGLKKEHLNKIKKIKEPQTPYKSKFKAEPSENFPIVAIATSSGGPKALKAILPFFPENLPAGILIVQHMPEGFTASLANRLNDLSKITVKEAEEGDKIEPGKALVAPGNYHMLVKNKDTVTINQSPPRWSVRPCADHLFSSAAKIFKNRVIGVVLTGMGYDGAEGMKVICQNNGYGIVEDKNTALVYGMPGSVIKADAYNEIIPLPKIASKIIKTIERRFVK